VVGEDRGGKGYKGSCGEGMRIGQREWGQMERTK